MQKISQIIPTSTRVSSVDLNEGQAVRPGAPSFGRPMGVSSLSEQNKMTTAQKAMQAHTKLMTSREKDALNAGRVEQIANDFFMKKSPAAEVSIGSTPAAVLDSQWDTLGHVAQRIEANQNADRLIAQQTEGGVPVTVDPETNEVVPNEFVPPGTYLDVSA